MKILIALSRFPLPIDKGDKLRAYYQIKELSKNHDLYLVCLTTAQPPAKDLEQMKLYCKQVILVRLSWFQIGLNLMRSLFNSLPFQVNYFRSSSMKSKIEGLIISEKIDLCYVQLVRVVSNIPFGLNTGYYIDYMDCLSEGMKNRYRFSRWYEKIPVSLEYKRLRKYEEKVFGWFQGASIITRADAEAFPEPIKSKLAIISNGVGNHFYKDTISSGKRYDLIFTGNMAYHPNVIACKYLVNEIMPLLKKVLPDIKLCIAGTEPTKEVMGLADKNTEVTGYVPTISDYLSQATLFVAPLFSGSGLQNKLLESMASGLPTLTSPSAAKALGARNGVEIIVCKDKNEFAEQILFLLENESKANEVGLNGQAFVKSRFSWQECNRLLEKEFERILSFRDPS